MTMRQINKELIWPLDWREVDIVAAESGSMNINADNDPEIDDLKPVKRKSASAPSSNARSSHILPDNWMNLEVGDLATALTESGVDPVIVKEHFIPNGKKVKKEDLIVLPSNWRDKLRDELIEELCTKNKLLDREVIATELQESEFEPSSHKHIKVKLPTNWRSMTKEELEVNGISL